MMPRFCRNAGILLGTLMLSACSVLSPDPADLTFQGASPDAPITLGQLTVEIRNLADRFAMRVAEACDHIKAGTDSWEIRREAHLLKLRNATSAYDAVTGGDAPEGLLDLVALIELQNIVWGDGGAASRDFHDPAASDLLAALGDSRKEAWELAARVLNQGQLDKFKEVFREWRRQNPGVQGVAFVRFNSGAGAGSASLLHEIRSGLGGLINPFQSSTHAANATRNLADRAFYFTKRLPMLLEWETEAAAGGTVDLNRVERLVEDASSVSRAAAGWPREAKTLLQFALTGGAGLLVLTFALLAGVKSLDLLMARKSSGKPPPPATRFRSPS
jgi:hypothetical protein